MSLPDWHRAGDFRSVYENLFSGEAETVWKGYKTVEVWSRSRPVPSWIWITRKFAELLSKYADTKRSDVMDALWEAVANMDPRLEEIARPRFGRPIRTEALTEDETVDIANMLMSILDERFWKRSLAVDFGDRFAKCRAAYVAQQAIDDDDVDFCCALFVPEAVRELCDSDDGKDLVMAKSMMKLSPKFARAYCYEIGDLLALGSTMAGRRLDEVGEFFDKEELSIFIRFSRWRGCSAAEWLRHHGLPMRQLHEWPEIERTGSAEPYEPSPRVSVMKNRRDGNWDNDKRREIGSMFKRVQAPRPTAPGDYHVPRYHKEPPRLEPPTFDPSVHADAPPVNAGLVAAGGGRVKITASMIVSKGS